jgi:SAM-dependent methyltransferase
MNMTKRWRPDKSSKRGNTALPTERFSNRVENYIKYRPGYPPEIVEILKAECGLTPAAVVADVGSGTGILTELLLKNGNRVFGVEPNREMREAAERLLAGYANFTSVAAPAESTTLPVHSVDLVVAAQAFHWFDRAAARREFARILKPGGRVVFLWNERRATSSPFLRAYEGLLQTYAPEYKQVDHKQVAAQEAIADFFSPGSFALARFSNQQAFDFEGLKGRLLSASYTPEAGHPNHQPMLDGLRALFEAHQVGGCVTLEYETRMYYGQLPERQD